MVQTVAGSLRSPMTSKAQGFFVPVMVSSRWTERSQAAFHSAFVMCVARSQNSRHAAKPSRPPPGVDTGTPELPPVGRAVGTAVELEVVLESGAIGLGWVSGTAVREAGAGAAGADGVGITPKAPRRMTGFAGSFAAGVELRLRKAGAPMRLLLSDRPICASATVVAKTSPRVTATSAGN